MAGGIITIVLNAIVGSNPTISFPLYDTGVIFFFIIKKLFTKESLLKFQKLFELYQEQIFFVSNFVLTILLSGVFDIVTLIIGLVFWWDVFFVLYFVYSFRIPLIEVVVLISFLCRLVIYSYQLDPLLLMV
jgi:hypothetical protein